MYRTIAISSIAATILGFGSVGVAQSDPTALSPAQSLGVQERSLAKDFKTQRPATSLETNQSAPAGNPNGRVLYRIDQNTRVLIGPAGGSTAGTELPTLGQQGDNRLQLLHDLEQ